MTLKELINQAITEFNMNPPFDEVDGRKVYHHARRPILATDCDYEIVSISGVQGKHVRDSGEVGVKQDSTSNSGGR